MLFGPDASGTYGVALPDFLLNSSGVSADHAIEDAAASMDEELLECDRRGEPFPEPTPAEAVDLDGGRLIMIAVRTPVAV